MQIWADILCVNKMQHSIKECCIFISIFILLKHDPIYTTYFLWYLQTLSAHHHYGL